MLTALGSGDALLLRLKDRQVGEYWRAVVGIKGRLVTISATGTDQVPLAPQDGRDVVDSVLNALRSSNATAS